MLRKPTDVYIYRDPVDRRTQQRHENGEVACQKYRDSQNVQNQIRTGTVVAKVSIPLPPNQLCRTHICASREINSSPAPGPTLNLTHAAMLAPSSLAGRLLAADAGGRNARVKSA